VFINRPFTASVADAEEIVRLARKHEAPLLHVRVERSVRHGY
jgi:predicted dehydrogenase